MASQIVSDTYNPRMIGYSSPGTSTSGVTGTTAYSKPPSPVQGPVPSVGYFPQAPSGYVPNTTHTTDTSQPQQKQTYIDPYAKYGGTAAFNRLVEGFGTQKNNIYGTANDAAANAGIGLRGSILDFVQSLERGQQNIDNRGINADLAKQQGLAGVQGMVGRGIRSGGVMLANKNAGDSSASGAIARAYGDIGRREASGIGQQYGLENREIGQAQEQLYGDRTSGIRKIEDSKSQVVNSIVAEARDKFAQLDAAMLDADIPDRIAIEQEKAAVKSQILAALAQYDTMLSTQAGAVKAMDADTRRAEAAKLAREGIAPSDAYSYSNSTPAEFQGTGPFPSELPVFQFPRGTDEEA